MKGVLVEFGGIHSVYQKKKYYASKFWKYLNSISIQHDYCVTLNNIGLFQCIYYLKIEAIMVACTAITTLMLQQSEAIQSFLI